MSPWEVIEEALAQRRPPRGPAWLAEQLDEKVQVVSNWKTRGRVPPGRYRQIASVLGLTVDQLEGLEPPPWERTRGAAPPPSLLPEVAELAWQINNLPPKHREVALAHIRPVLELIRENLAATAESLERNSEIDQHQDLPSAKRMRGT